MATHTLKERTYLTVDGKVTTSELEANELLGNAGDEVLEDRAIELGLVKGSAASKAAPAAEAPASTSEQISAAVAEFTKGLRAMKAAQLRAAAEEHGVSTDGNADAVRARMIAAAEANPGAFVSAGEGEDPDVDDSGDGNADQA